MDATTRQIFEFLPAASAEDAIENRVQILMEWAAAVRARTEGANHWPSKFTRLSTAFACS